MTKNTLETLSKYKNVIYANLLLAVKEEGLSYNVDGNCIFLSDGKSCFYIDNVLNDLYITLYIKNSNDSVIYSEGFQFKVNEVISLGEFNTFRQIVKKIDSKYREFNRTNFLKSIYNVLTFDIKFKHLGPLEYAFNSSTRLERIHSHNKNLIIDFDNNDIIKFISRKPNYKLEANIIVANQDKYELANKLAYLINQYKTFDTKFNGVEL